MARFIPDDDWRDEYEAACADERAERLAELSGEELAEHRAERAARARRKDPVPRVPWQPSSSDGLDSEGYAW